MRTFVAGCLLLCAASLGADQNVTVGPDLSFSPSTVTIAPGETVIWTWAGASHSSTSDATSGPEVWDSGIISAGTFSHTFTTLGSFPYYCKLHSVPGGSAMNGVVQVVLPTVTPTPTSPLPTPTASASPTPTISPVATPSASPTAGAPGPAAAVPALGSAGRLALLLALAAAGVLSLSLALRR